MTRSINLATIAAAAAWPRLSSWLNRRVHLLVCAAVVLFAAAYVSPILLRGWVPFDEGTLAQSAHRVLIGQLPHRDFDELYTGGLSFANAVAFRLFGETLASLRFVLFAAILMVMPACYYIASRFASPMFAAGLSIAALVASFPSYPAAMPSWYNLILALFGCAAFLRYLETEKSHWVFAAGFCGGLSVAVKIVGVYFLAAGALILIFHAFTPNSHDAAPGARSRSGASLALVLLVIIAAGPFLIMYGRLRVVEAVELGLPVSAVSACVAVEVWRSSSRPGSTRPLARLMAAAWPFAIGALLPVLCLVVPYMRSGALGSFYRGVLILPQRRLNLTAEDGPPVIALLLGLPPIYLMMSRRFSHRAARRYDGMLVGVLEIVLVGWSAVSLTVTASLWSSIRMAAPLVVLTSAVVIVSSQSQNRVSALRRQQLLVLASAAAWCALVQFPVGTYQYFLYVLPLFVLAGGALTSTRGTLARSVAMVTLAAFIALGVLLRPVFAAGGGSNVVLKGQSTSTLDLPRGGLTVGRGERDEYVHLVALIQQHSRSAFIYVSPDAPEVYFLANQENPTRTLFDLFDDPRDRTNQVLAVIRAHHVNVVVINNRPRFSGKMPQALRDSLTSHFDESTEVGQFEVRWRS